MDQSGSFCSRPAPLRIDEVVIPKTGGRIGMTSCPGRKLARLTFLYSSEGNRNLETDLAAIRDWGAEILISLIEEHEYSLVGVTALPKLVPAGIRYLQLPIEDGSIPDASWEKSWFREGPVVRTVLQRSGSICIHCMGGYGRTGLVAARLLVEFGSRPEEAIHSVRQARPGAIETLEQENYIRALRLLHES
ncbi:MAG: cyclin-dependent kinase inhibitor 3 family protein [Spirochaetaceae bacterium]|nr:cyclin-dependent kinase inhibitor 3 family protein [Spirochaetaceae bacterium]